MDADRFDTFVLALDHAFPRRVALAGVLSTGLAGLLARLGVDIAEARKRKKKKKCKGGKKRCGKKCLDLQTNPLHCGSCGNVCDVDRECVGGNCSCQEGEKDCGEACIPQVDCCSDADCGEGEPCIDGACVCPVGKAVCGSACVDLATDGANCGACGKACDTNGCVHGACTCDLPEDCNGCVCALRIQGGQACSGDLLTDACITDDDCPLGAFCRDTPGGTFCSEPCPV